MGAALKPAWASNAYCINQLKGDIVDVSAATSDIRVDIDNGVLVTATITNEAVAQLNLKRR
jgi:molybdopterin-binding protein